MNYKLIVFFIGFVLFFAGCSNNNSNQKIEMLQNEIINLKQQNNNIQSKLDEVQNSLLSSQSELYEKSEQLRKDTEKWKRERDCLLYNYKQYGNEQSYYEEGEILITFNTTTKDIVESIISTNGLKIKTIHELTNRSLAVVEVPIKKEIEWACSLLFNDEIASASVNGFYAAI